MADKGVNRAYTEPFECNGGGKHIAIRYGSQPCPLCASHRLIERLRDALHTYWGSDSCDYDHGQPANEENAFDEDGEQCDCRAHEAWRALCDAYQGE